MPKKAEFVHLHNHSEYSLLDGGAALADGKGRPSPLIQGMAKMGFKSMALTDHGNMFGAPVFYRACKSVGIKPIAGIEAYMAPNSRFDKEKGMANASNHMTILAHSQTGYQNLLKLTSLSYLEGFHYKPRIDKEILARHSEGLIGFSGCLNGEIPQALGRDDQERAMELTNQYRDIFGKENFYFEIMAHGLKAQNELTPKLVTLGKKMGVKLVGTNDCHYVKSDDHFAHDVLLCIGTGKKLTETKRLKFDTNDFYYKSPEEMVAVFKDFPEAIQSTLEIGERCQWELDFNRLLLPQYKVPAGFSPETYLKKLCLEGLAKRKGSVTDTYKQRLEMELGIIERMGFAPYFLIVWDFIHFARQNDIPVGPGRGSGAGSLVAYSLKITSIDPIQNGLLFERFLNPDRRSMPDLDIDFSDEGRERVIQYVREKYGESCVAQIITFGSMLARGVVRDVGRVLEMPLPDVDKIAGLIPRELGITIDAAMKSVSELRDLYKKNPQVTRLIDLARRLEGLKRHTGVHAAGTVIAAGDITDYVPVCKNNKDIVTTQFDGDILSKLGLLKVDFLGLRTLTVIRGAVELIRQRVDKTFDIEAIPEDDKKAYDLLGRAETAGVFQLESSGMRDLLRKLKPTCLSDITALISLYRPGPMGSGMLDEFVERKRDPSKVKYDHPLMKPIIEETHGIIVYQEQVMKISQVLAGFTPGEADGLRKAMGKKIQEELEKQRGKFIEGAEKNKIDKKLANSIFDLMAHFGGYGFNKSHASAYGLVSYQTAYLKANYPVEYMAALCTSEIGRSTVASKEVESKLVGYLNDCKSMGIEVLGPNIQKSGAVFTVESPVNSKKPQIRFGLTAIKNVGVGAVESMTATRDKNGLFESLDDLCTRIDTRLANRKVIESLIKAGALDGFSEEPVRKSRARLFERIEETLKLGSKAKSDAEFAEGSLFGEAEVKSFSKRPAATVLPSSAEWTEHVLLANEKEVLGLYLSGHPLARYMNEIATYTTSTLGRLPQSGIVRVAGHVLSVRRLTTKRGHLMARIVLEDLEGEAEVIIFPKMLTPEINELLVPNSMLVIKGKIENREFQGKGTREILAEEIISFLRARDRFVRSLTVKLESSKGKDEVFDQLKGIFERHPGLCRVNLLLPSQSNGRILLETKAGIKPSDSFIKELENVLGPDCWSFGRYTVKQ